MNKLRDKEALKNIDKSELIKSGKVTFYEGQTDEYPEEGIQGYISIYNNSVYLNGKEMVLKYDKIFANAHPDLDANVLPIHWQRETDKIYFDENGQYYENVEENPDIKEKADNILSKVMQKHQNISKHKIKNFFKSLFGNKRYLSDTNTLTVDEIQDRLDKICEKQFNFMDKYNTKKTEEEINKDKTIKSDYLREKKDSERAN